MKTIMQTTKPGVLLVALISISASSLAQVPPLITYQGLVQSGGTNFTGTGWFKFAIIDGITQPTAAPHFAAGGPIIGATVMDGGSGYVAPPTVTVTDPTGSGASLTAVLAGGSVVSLTVNNGGTGYTDPTIHIAPPSENFSFWSNDGTAGGEPATAVGVEVEDGFFAIVLGQDTTGLSPSIFNHPGLYLRQWFSDGESGFVRWTNDIRLTAVPYAMVAAQLAGGSVAGEQIADGAVGSTELAPDSVSSGHIIDREVHTEDLADESVTSDKLANAISIGSTATSGQLDVWDGVDEVQAFELNGSSHVLSVYGSDGLERIQLWGDGTGQIRLHDTTNANLTAWLTAGNDGLVAPQLLLSSGEEGGGARAQLLGSTSGGSLSLMAGDGLRALLEGDESDGGRLTLRRADGPTGAVLYGEENGGEGNSGVGALSLRNVVGSPRARIYGGSSGRMYLYNDSGTNTFAAHGGGSDGSEVRLLNSSGRETITLDGQWNPDEGGRISLAQADGTETIILQADHGGTGRIIADVLEINGADLSERFHVTARNTALEPGMVVCIDAQEPGRLVLSTKAYDRAAAGIISGAGGVRPGLLMRQQGTLADGEHAVALTGRVYCNVDATAAPIKPGDLITTSDTPGYGMKVTDHARALGAIIGKAMTGLDRGRGQILVLVSLQ